MQTQDASACLFFDGESSTGWDPGFFLNKGEDPGSPTNLNSTWRYEHLDSSSVEDGFLDLDPSNAQTQQKRSQSEEISISPFLQKQDSAPNFEEERWPESPVFARYKDHQVHLDRESCAKVGSSTLKNGKHQTTQLTRMSQRQCLEAYTEGPHTHYRPLRAQKNWSGKSEGITLALRMKLNKAPEELLEHL